MKGGGSFGGRSSGSPYGGKYELIGGKNYNKNTLEILHL